MRDDQRDGTNESRRILDRVEQSSTWGLAGRLARRTGAHVAARDADQSDPVEVWGTRIGRVLGLAVLLGICIWLFALLLGGR